MNIDLSTAEISFNIEEGLVIQTPEHEIVLDGGATRTQIVDAIQAAVQTPAPFATLARIGMCDYCDDHATGEREGESLCDDHMPEIIPAEEQCDQCEERATNHWPDLQVPVQLCDSCEHNARRSGWEPGQ